METGKSMIPCVQWIPKGYAKQNPITNADLEKQMQEMMSNEDLIKNKKKYDQMMAEEMQMNKEEMQDEGEEVIPVFAKEANLNYQKDQKNLPFAFNDSDEEKDDYTIKSTDNMIVAGKIEDEFSHLEIYIYEENNYNLYVHHDIMLSSFPICLEWLGVDPSTLQESESSRGNYAILGSFLSDIEIWNLDILDNVEPSIILKGNGQEHLSSGNPDGHSGAVISLSLNEQRKQILASGSADATVKIWDLTKETVALTHKCGGFKPEKVLWHPTESSVLVISTDDNYLRAADIRTPKEIGAFKFDASIEDFCFDNNGGKEIHASFGNGFIGGIDIVNGFKPSYGVQCSKKAITSISMSNEVKGLLTLTAMDSVLRVYNTAKREEDNSPVKVEKLLTRGGNLFNGSFCPDSAYLYCCGSSSGDLVLWNMGNAPVVLDNFPKGTK